MTTSPTIQTNPLDPVFSGVPVVYPQIGMVNPTWNKWFVDLREKVNVINATVAALSGGTLKPVIKVHAGTNVTVDNTDIQNPIVSASSGGSGTVPYAAAVVPLAASFTLLQSTPNLTLFDRIGRLIIEVPSAMARPRCLLQTLPAPPYTIDIGGNILGTLASSSDAYALSLGLSDGTKIQSLSFAFFNNGIKYSIDNWTNTTTFSGNLFSEASYNSTLPIFLRLTSDGTTNKFYTSFNGLDFVLMYSYPYATFLTPTLGGIEVYNNSARSIPATAEIFRFVITNSILGDAS